MKEIKEFIQKEPKEYMEVVQMEDKVRKELKPTGNFSLTNFRYFHKVLNYIGTERKKLVDKIILKIKEDKKNE